MDDSRHRLPIGYHLNQKYEIRKVLGEGGFGITYLARDIVLDLDVAVKEYYPSGLVMREITNGCTVLSFTGDKQEYFRMGREKFIQEAQALGRLSGQPGSVSVRDYFQENNTAYIVMEYLQGETKLQENILYKIVGGNKGKIGFSKFEDTMYLRIESETPSGDANTVEVSYLPWSSQAQAPSLDGSYYLYGSYAYEDPENGDYRWGDNRISRSDYEQSYNAWEWKYCLNPLEEPGNGDVMTLEGFRSYLNQLQ